MSPEQQQEWDDLEERALHSDTMKFTFFDYLLLIKYRNMEKPLKENKNELCGCLEPCFKEGLHWGHFSLLMCEYLTDNGKSSICTKYDIKVKLYTSLIEYKACLNAIK